MSIINITDSNGNQICSIERVLSTKARNDLPDSSFGLPKDRKYPLYTKDGKPDKNHIKSAISYYNKCDKSKKIELANNIMKAAKKADMTINEDSLKSEESLYVSPTLISEIAVFAVSSIAVAITGLVNHIHHMQNDPSENFWSNSRNAKVSVNNGIVEISHINFRGLMNKLLETYGEDSNIYKLLIINYNNYDYRKYKHGSIDTKAHVRIKYIQFYEFFSMEMVNIFNQLAESYDFEPYKAIAQAIIQNTYLNNLANTKPYTSPLSKEVKDELKDNPLLDHQKDFIEQYDYLKSQLQLRGIILSFDQGLGKTLTAIALGLNLKKEQFIVVCPNTVTSVWADEICDKLYSYKIDKNKQLNNIYVDHDVTKRFNSAKNPKYIIVNNEAVEKIDSVIDYKKSTIVVIDECQNFRYTDGSRWLHLYEMITKLYDSLGDKLDVLPMSGTPIKAKPSEIVPAMMCIDPKFTLEPAKIYTKAFDIDTTAAQRIIEQRFSQVIYRKVKAQVLDLPNKIMAAIKFTISNPEKYYIDNVKSEILDEFIPIYNQKFKDIYTDRKDFEELVNRYCKNAPMLLKTQYLNYLKNTIAKGNTVYIHEYTMEQFLSFSEKYVVPNISDKETLKRFYKVQGKYVYIRQSAMGVAIGKILPKRRAEMFCDIIDQNQEAILDYISKSVKKTAMFSNSLQVIDKLEAFCKDNDLGYVKITGGNAKDRKSLIDQFKNDEDTDVLIGTNSTMGVGVTITCANTELVFGPPWRDTDFNQLADRIHRIGQTTDCYIYNCLLQSEKPNLSDRMNEIMTWSGSMTDAYIENSTLKDD